MINKTRFIALSLTVAFIFLLPFSLMAAQTPDPNAAERNSSLSPAPSCYDRIVDRIAEEKGISKEEAKLQLEAKLKEIADKKGISVDELKKQLAERKFQKGKCGPHHRGKLDEAKLKEIAEKKGLTVEELKERMKESPKAKK